MTSTLLPTSLVGSYPQPDWLSTARNSPGDFRRACVAGTLARRPEWLEQAQDDATGSPFATRNWRASTSSLMAKSAGESIPTVLRPNSTASISTIPEPPWTAAAIPTRCRASSARSSAAARWRCAISISSQARRTSRVKMTVPGPFTMSVAGAERFLQRRGEMVARLRGRGERRNQGPVRGGRQDVVQIDEPYMQARPDEGPRSASRL